MSSTVQMGKITVTSSDPASQMVEALTPKDEKADKPKVLVDRGDPVKDEGQSEASDAARKLGRLGGKAAAEARQERQAEDKAKQAVDAQERRAEQKMADEGVDAGEADSEAKSKEAKGEAADTGTDTAEEKPPSPRNSAQERIKQLARERREAEERFRAAEERNRQLEERLSRLERGERPAEKQPERDPSAKPTPDQYASYEEFAEALTDWKMDQRIAKLREESDAQNFQTVQEQRVSKHVQGFRERVGKALEADPGFLDRIDPRLLELKTSFQERADAEAEGRQAQLGPGHLLADLCIRSPQAVALMEHFTAHPEEVIRLLRDVALEGPEEFAREFGMIEAMLKREESAPAPQPSKAPPPVRPIAPSAHVGKPDLFAARNMDEYAAMRRRS